MTIAFVKGGGGTILALMCPFRRAMISSLVLGFLGLNGGGTGITLLTLAPG